MEYDPLFIGLSAAFTVSILMTLSSRLADTTRFRTFGFVALYGIGLGILYYGDFCTGILGSDYCNRILEMRQDVVTNYVGIDPISVVSFLSGIVGFTIGASGTRSLRWKLLGGILFTLFLLSFFFRFILPRLPTP